MSQPVWILKKSELSAGNVRRFDVCGNPLAVYSPDGTFYIPIGKAMSFPCEKAPCTYKVIDQGDSVAIDIHAEADAASYVI